MNDLPTSVFVDETGHPIICLCGIKYFSKELCCPRCNTNHDSMKANKKFGDFEK